MRISRANYAFYVHAEQEGIREKRVRNKTDEKIQIPVQ